MSRLFEPSEPLAKTEDIALRTIPYNYLAVERHHNRNHLLSRLVADLITLSARRASHLLACFLSSFSLPGRSGLFPPGTNELPKIWSPSLVTTFCSKVWPRSSADPELWLPNHCLEFSPAELPMNLPIFLRTPALRHYGSVAVVLAAYWLVRFDVPVEARVVFQRRPWLGRLDGPGMVRAPCQCRPRPVSLDLST
jgi:hypothetical protein